VNTYTSRIEIRRSPSRRAYALLMVLMFNVLFLMLLGVAWRQMASALRVAKVRKEQVQRDEGVVCAMARAMHLLETGRPPIGAGTAYQCYTTIGTRYFPITFTLTSAAGAIVETWKIDVAAQDTPPSSSGPNLTDAWPP
jgi:hypothetical protein